MKKENEKKITGQELVNYLIKRWNMTEDEALKSLSKNIGNVKINKHEKRK